MDAVPDEARCVIFVDKSNRSIEGPKVFARRKGVSRDPQGPSWRIDLLDFMGDGRDTIAAILVGSEPPSNDSVWSAAKRKGFEVLTYNRSYRRARSRARRLLA